ncbi:MAG: ATP-dependent Zn protease [Phormidesmis sp.]
MNPITFNLLAVSVFAFVLLSLVGPLLNISPGAVAVVLAGCAGIIAVDRFGAQGRGGNLLIDLLSGRSSEYRQRILHHEAGHFLVAHLLGIPVESYTLSAWEGLKAGLPGLGGVVVDTAEAAEVSPSLQQINRYCTLWMAGIAAEVKTYGSAQGGDDDKAQLKQLWQGQHDRTGERSDVDTQLRWSLLQAQTLIETQQNAYEALVSAMSNRDPVDICCQQIEAHRLPAE